MFNDEIENSGWRKIHSTYMTVGDMCDHITQVHRMEERIQKLFES